MVVFQFAMLAYQKVNDIEPRQRWMVSKCDFNMWLCLKIGYLIPSIGWLSCSIFKIYWMAIYYGYTPFSDRPIHNCWFCPIKSHEIPIKFSIKKQCYHHFWCLNHHTQTELVGFQFQLRPSPTPPVSSPWRWRLPSVFEASRTERPGKKCGKTIGKP